LIWKYFLKNKLGIKVDYKIFMLINFFKNILWKVNKKNWNLFIKYFTQIKYSIKKKKVEKNKENRK
jgi:hypothetical protein